MTSFIFTAGEVGHGGHFYLFTALRAKPCRIRQMQVVYAFASKLGEPVFLRPGRPRKICDATHEIRSGLTKRLFPRKSFFIYRSVVG